MRQKAIPRAVRKIDPETFNAAVEASSNFTSNLTSKAKSLIKKGVQYSNLILKCTKVLT